MTATHVMQVISAPGVPSPPGATWSNCLRLGDEIVLSGVTAHPATTPTGQPLSTHEQTLRILQKIDTQLQAAGASRANLYKLVIYLTDMTDKDAVSRARATFFAGLHYPCSTLVGIAALAFPGLSIEIDAFARQTFTLPAQ